MKKIDKIFHNSAGTRLTPSNIIRTIGVGAKDIAKRAGNIISKPFDKAIEYEKRKDARMEDMRIRAERGEYNN